MILKHLHQRKGAINKRHKKAHKKTCPKRTGFFSSHLFYFTIILCLIHPRFVWHRHKAYRYFLYKTMGSQFRHNL